MPDKLNRFESAPEIETALEHHVDEMMDKSLPNPPQMHPERSTAPTLPPSPAYSEPAASSDNTPPNQQVEPDSSGSLVDAATASHQNVPDSPDRLTDALVDDIVIRESDELLASRDEHTERSFEAASPPPPRGNRLAALLAGWGHNKPLRYIFILLVLAGFGGLATLPTSRYYAMNIVGVRSSASLTILDNTTQLPLKNVNVEMAGRKAKTNQDGQVKLSGLQLGTQSLSVSQPGFAAITKTITLGLGSNPLGEFTLEAVGTQFRFKLTDYLSGKPIKDAEISSGDANAQVDDNGQLVLTIAQESSASGKATISAKGYRIENLQLDIGQKQSRTVVMVPRQKEVYVSKQSGKYDLYKVDIDGKNKQVLLAASGNEDENISVVVQPSGENVALVSRRDMTKNQDGFPLQALTIVDVDKGSSLNLDHSEHIQIVDWLGDKLVYVKIKAGTSAGNPERYQLMSYDYETTARLQLATANNFNDVISAEGDIYYAASNNFQDGTSQLVKINTDNTGRLVLLDKTDVWNLARTSYDTIEISTFQGVYSYKIGDPTARKTSEKPTNSNETRFYLDASDGRQSLWTDKRDGKGVLLTYNASSNKDVVRATHSGLSYPVRWLNARTIIYRVTTPAETADYAVSLDGGTPKKIVDLTNTAGLGKWNYR